MQEKALLEVGGLEANDLQAILNGDDEATGSDNDSAKSLDGAGEKAGAEASAAAADELANIGEGSEGEQPQVLSRDGKHTIPYSQLEEARTKAALEAKARQEAEERAAALESQFTELKDRLTSLEAGTGSEKSAQEAADIAAELNEEDMQAFREDFPAFARILDAMTQTNKALNIRLEALGNRDQAATENENPVASAVTAAIDANPVLKALQADPAAFDKAIELDNHFKTHPVYKHLSLAERFDKVAAEYQTIYGKVDTTQKTDASHGKEKHTAGKPFPVSMDALGGGEPTKEGLQATVMSQSNAQAINTMSQMSKEGLERLLEQM